MDIIYIAILIMHIFGGKMLIRGCKKKKDVVRMYNLLVADDVKIERDCILYLIKEYQFPFTVTSVSNGKEAMEEIEKQVFDFVITDIKMPFFSGLEIAQAAKNKNDEVTTILISGYSDFEYARTAITIGIKNYLLKPVDPEELESCLKQLLKEKTEQSKNVPVQDMDGNNSSHHTIIFVKNYIEQHYQENIGLDALAEMAHANANYLSKLFKKETGTNINRYIRNYRLLKAKEFLQNTNMKITEISEAVGYTNCSYFCQNFSDFFGASPAKYRNVDNEK